MTDASEMPYVPDDPKGTVQRLYGSVVGAASSWKWPITVISVTLIVAVAAWDARIPTPPGWVTWFVVSYGFLFLLSMLVASPVVNWVLDQVLVKVVEIGGVMDDIVPWVVHPDDWNSRDYGERDAYRPDTSDVWRVIDFEYMDGIDQVQVEGTWPSVADPLDVHVSQVQWELTFNGMIRELIKANALRATVSKAGVDIMDESVMEMMQFQETGELPAGVGVEDVIRDMESRAEDMLDLESLDDFESTELNGDTWSELERDRDAVIESELDGNNGGES